MVTAALEAAWSRRARLRQRLEKEGTDAYRLFAGVREGIDGLVVDRYGPVVLALEQLGACRLTEADWAAVGAWLLARPGVQSVYRKRLAVDRSQALAEAALYDHTPLAGVASGERTPAAEYGVRFLVSAHAGYSTGLFLDQRENRHFLAGLAAGGSVLNCFSYTCGFSVTAARAGAETTSVDLSRKWLDWGRENFRANGLDPDRHRFFADDCFVWFPRAERKGLRFSLVVVDPPSFARGKRGAFSIRRDLEPLVAGAAALVAPGGHLFVSTNLAGAESDALATRVRAALGRGVRESLPPVAEDFERAASPLAACLYRIP